MKTWEFRYTLIRWNTHLWREQMEDNWHPIGHSRDSNQVLRILWAREVEGESESSG